MQEAWKVAEMCGLEPEFLRAPENFNVGKGGRNLPVRLLVPRNSTNKELKRSRLSQSVKGQHYYAGVATCEPNLNTLWRIRQVV